MACVRKLLAASDFSKGAESAVRRAATLACHWQAGLEIVHALQAPPADATWRRLAEEGGLTEHRLLERIDFRLRELAAGIEHRFGVRPAVHVQQGRPAQAVTDRAREQAVDLIVVGAHGERFLLDIFVGATARF